MSINETFSGLGLICGPVLGGWLYQVGGFQLPFIAIAVAMFLGAIFNLIVIKHNEMGEAPGNFFLLFKIPNVVVTSIFLWTIATSLDFNMLLLAVHMKELGNYSPVLVGIMFGLMAGGYTLCNPFLGFCTKTKVSQRITMIVGSFIISTSYLLIGPSPIFAGIHFTDVTIWNVSVAMIALGIGQSFSFVPTFDDLYNSALHGGMEDNLSTSGIVGGLFISVNFCGEFVGPVLAGGLMDQFNDFKVVSSIYSAMLYIVTFAVAIFYFIDWTRSRSTLNLQRVHRKTSCSERDPLLSTIISNDIATI